MKYVERVYLMLIMVICNGEVWGDSFFLVSLYHFALNSYNERIFFVEKQNYCYKNKCIHMD